MEHYFTTFLRTKLLLHSRIKNNKDQDTIKVSVKELKKLHVYGPIYIHTYIQTYTYIHTFNGYLTAPVQIHTQHQCHRWTEDTNSNRFGSRAHVQTYTLHSTTQGGRGTEVGVIMFFPTSVHPLLN